MKILTVKNKNTKDCIEIRADDKRIYSYKNLAKDVKVGDHITYTDTGNMRWLSGLVIGMKKSTLS